MGYTRPVLVTELAVLKASFSGRLSPTLAGSVRLPKVLFHGPFGYPRVTNVLYCHNVTLWDPNAFSDRRQSSEFTFLSSLSQPLVLSLRIQTLPPPLSALLPFSFSDCVQRRPLHDPR